MDLSRESCLSYAYRKHLPKYCRKEVYDTPFETNQLCREAISLDNKNLLVDCNNRYTEGLCSSKKEMEKSCSQYCQQFSKDFEINASQKCANNHCLCYRTKGSREGVKPFCKEDNKYSNINDNDTGESINSSTNLAFNLNSDGKAIEASKNQDNFSRIRILILFFIITSLIVGGLLLSLNIRSAKDIKMPNFKKIY